MYIPLPLHEPFTIAMRYLLLSLVPLCLLATAALVRAKRSHPEPVRGFEPRRYLGKWYEFARMPVWFERGLVNVTATYSLREDGMISVVNEGDREEDGTHKVARGKAKFASGEDTGHLRVSFFGPFYADYIIVELDKQEYRYALVSGGGTRTLWILSREPEMDHSVVEHLVARADSLGFDTGRLIFTPQKTGTGW